MSTSEKNQIKMLGEQFNIILGKINAKKTRDKERMKLAKEFLREYEQCTHRNWSENEGDQYGGWVAIGIIEMKGFGKIPTMKELRKKYEMCPEGEGCFIQDCDCEFCIDK